MFCYFCHSPVTSQDNIYGLHPGCFRLWFSVDPSEKFQDVIARGMGSQEMDTSSDKLALVSSFFHGKFKKYSAKLGNKTYLLKVKETPYDELPATEYLCNLIAMQLKLEIPKCHFILFETLPTLEKVLRNRYQELINAIA